MALRQSSHQLAPCLIHLSQPFTANPASGAQTPISFFPPDGRRTTAHSPSHSCRLGPVLDSAWHSRKRLWRPLISYHGYYRSSVG